MHRLTPDGDFEATSRLRCAIEMRSSAASTTALGELTSKVSAKPNKGTCGSAQLKVQIRRRNRSCADTGAPGNSVGALLSGVGAPEMGANVQEGSPGAICKSDLKEPKFQKLAKMLGGLSAQADLDEAIQAPVQLKSKKKRGEQALVRRTRTRRSVRMEAQPGAKLSPRAVLGRILRGRLTLICGGQIKPRTHRIRHWWRS